MRKSAIALLVIVLWSPAAARAVVYNVNRSFRDIGTPAGTLTGTVTAPIGNYVVQNQSASPITNVNLTLNVGGASVNLTSVSTLFVRGSGQFLINATPTTLTFSTANANGSNPADLTFLFSDFNTNFYGIGSDTLPMFEVGITNAGSASAKVTFPTVFGTADVPEPSSLLLLAAAAISLRSAIRIKRSSFLHPRLRYNGHSIVDARPKQQPISTANDLLFK
jgi:hypothetical protein